VVIAETARRPRDAAELIEVDYQPLRPSVSAAKAKNGPALHEVRARQHMLCLGHRATRSGRMRRFCQAATSPKAPTS